MEKYTQIFQELKRKMALTYPSFAQEISTTNISVDSRIQTAGTEGKNILFNPQFLDSLTDKQQLFVVAHEFFHIKFKHMFRLRDKDGNLRDMQLWNIATDAIINENLKDDGLEMVEGGVEMKNARKFTAEELYEKLLKEQERQNKKKLININLPIQNKNGNNKKQQNQSGENPQKKDNSQQENQKDNNKQQQNQNGENQQLNNNSQQNQGGSQQGNNNSQQNNNKQGNSGSSNNNQPNNDNPQQNSNQQSGNSSNNNQQNGNQNSSNGNQQQNNNDGNSQQNNGNQQNNNNSQDENDNAQGERSYTGDVLDDHSLWQKAFEDGNSEKDSDNNKNSNGSKKQGKDEANSDKDNSNKQNQNNDKEDNPDESESKQNNDGDIDEREEFEKNRELRRDIARNFTKQLKERGMGQGAIDRSVKDIGSEKEIVDWRQLLRREIDKTETLWTQRRSIAENNYAYRLEENDIDDEALTEVMLDTSGSVSTTLLRNFVRQLKPLLKKTKLKVGCFDTHFYGFAEIKNEKDIDKFTILGGGGTDFEGAIQNFTFKREVNKIVFTDGYDEMTMTDKKYADIVWIVFENTDFKPTVGKVIQVSHQDLKKLYNSSSKKNNSYYEDDDEYSF